MVATKYCASKNIIEAIHIFTQLSLLLKLWLHQECLLSVGLWSLRLFVKHMHDGSQFPTTWIKVANGVVMAFRFIHSYNYKIISNFSILKQLSNTLTLPEKDYRMQQVLMFYHLKTRRCVNTVLLQAS